MKATLYRAGLLDKEPYEPWAEFARKATWADSLRPAGRVSRNEGLFCSVDIDGLAMWFRANYDLAQHDSTPHQIRFDGPEPYVYPVMLWTVASCADQMREYWAAGVPLSQYLANRENYDSQHIWRDGHEVLVLPKHVAGSRRIAPTRIMAEMRCEWRAEEIAALVWPRSSYAVREARLAKLRGARQLAEAAT